MIVKKQEGLLGCPFCGKYPFEQQQNGSYWIGCKNQHCIMDGYRFKNKIEAYGIWNSRTGFEIKNCIYKAEATEQEAASRAAFEQYCEDEAIRQRPYYDREAAIDAFKYEKEHLIKRVWQARGKHDAEVMKAKDGLLKQALSAFEKIRTSKGPMMIEIEHICEGTIAAIQSHLASTGLGGEE